MSIGDFVPRQLAQLARPYGGYRMLLRSLAAPRTFSEKIQRTKLLNRDPRLPQRENKIVVKEFVRERLGSEWVIPTLWHGEYFPPVEQRNWPLPFVIKANNGCGWNVFIRRKIRFELGTDENLGGRLAPGSFGADIGEWLYGQIKPGLLVEPFIGSGPDLPVDYRLWTFGGKVKSSRSIPIVNVTISAPCSICTGINSPLRSNILTTSGPFPSRIPWTR